MSETLSSRTHDEARQGEAFAPAGEDPRTYRKKFYIESYGCQMNFADSEIVASILNERGFGATGNYLEADLVLLNTSRGLLKVRNLQRDPRMALCVEDGPRYVTLEGTAELVADRGAQEREVNEHIAPRYVGQRLGSRRWEAIQRADRIGIHMRITKVHARGL